MTSAPFELFRDWELTTLADAAARGGGDVQTGPFGSQLHASDYVSHGVPCVMPQNIGDNRISTEGIAHIREEDAQRLTKYRLRIGDIIYSRRGDVGRRSLVRLENDGWLCGTGCLRVRFGEGHVVPEYAAYYLGHPAIRQWIINHAVGATMPNLNTSILGAVPFVLPPMTEQRKIADVLGAFDDKIELNRRMNKTLEAMAQAIFRDWFVDFGPTRRKLAGITDPVEIMGGLVQDATHAAELAALFPNALGDDGLPEGWEKKPVGELAYIRGGKQLPKDEFDPAGNVPIFGGAGLMGFTNKSNADGFVITIGRVGAYCGKLFTYRGRAWVNNNASQFIPKSSVPPEWLYLSLCQLDIHNIRRGAAQPFVSNSDLAALSVVVPDDSILPQFMWLVTPIIIKSEQAASESRILAATRDLLLPKLMSGEIRLREAEKIAEAAP